MPSAGLLAALLAGLAIILAGPISALLARATWSRRTPRAALVLWQAVCLAAGVSLVGAGLVLALWPLGHNILTGLWRFLQDVGRGTPLAGMTGGGVVAGTLAGVAAVILFGVLLRSMALAVRRRRAHRMVLDLLTSETQIGHEEIGDLLVGVRILDHAAAVAYTVPGWHSRVVLSAGLLDLLDRDQLAAVINHERAHVRSRHDLLVLPFQAWATTLGWLPGVRQATTAVTDLTEMLADDWAARRSGSKVLAGALATVALAGLPGLPAPTGSQTPAATSHSVSGRVGRLLDPSPLPVLVTAAVYVLAAVVLAIPLAVLVIGWR